MKLIQLLILVLTTGFLAGGIMTSSAIQDQHCTTSSPCQKICGDHICAPGEVYSSLSSNTKIQNTTVSMMPKIPTSQNITSENNTFQNMSSSQIQMMTGISSIYDKNGTRMVS